VEQEVDIHQVDHLLLLVVVAAEQVVIEQDHLQI
jgi:hypothetical protein